MSIIFSSPIELNVVNVGDEISTDQLLAIQGANTPSATNPFATIDDVGGGGTENALPLAGGTMTGAIYFGTGGQNINEGTFDNGLGGYNGISLNCAVGYELNWQAGHLKCVDSYGDNTQITFDSGIDALSLYGQLTVADTFATIGVMQYGSGVSATDAGITFPDGSFQATATYGTGDQTVNTIDDVIFNSVTLGGQTGLWHTDGSGATVYSYTSGGYANIHIVDSNYNVGVHINYDTTSQVGSASFQDVGNAVQLTVNGIGITFPDGSFQGTAASGGSGNVINQTGNSPSSQYTAQIGDRTVFVDGNTTVDLTMVHATYSPPDASLGTMITIVNMDAINSTTIADAFSGIRSNQAPSTSYTLGPLEGVTLTQGTDGYWFVV